MHDPTAKYCNCSSDLLGLENLLPNLSQFFLGWKLHSFLDYLTETFLYANRTGSILGYAMACSNTFGLVTGAFLLGFGLSEIPKTLWKNADWTTRQKVLSHKIAKIAVKLDNAHQELSNAIVVSIIWN
jgi:hypothetical protein